MTQQTPYIGSKISLISKLDIRYEGILYTVDSKESTIALSKVRSFGTEDRNAAHVVPPQDEVYDYIIFKANDIKDLIVCETPKPPAPGLPYDPAILSVSQGNSGIGSVGEKPSVPAPVGSERSGSANATRSSTPRNANTRSPSSQQQQGQTWKNTDNKSNNSNYRQGNYQNRNNQNRQHGYEGNNKQPSRNYDSQNRNNGYQNNYRQGNGQQNNRNYESQNRGTYNNQNNRNGGGSRNQNINRGGNNRSHGGPRNNLKFENDYDFEKAYEQFKETLEAIVGDVQNIKIDDSHDNDASSVKSGEDNESFYDKNKSFFDSISCEALEKEEGKNTRPDWRKERLTNQETFGQQSVRSFGYRRGGYNNRGGGGYNNRGGNNGYNNRGGHQYNNRRGGYNNRGGDYNNKREGGGGGY